MLVVSWGSGVHGFTLDTTLGEFVLTHPNIQIPQRGERILSSVSQLPAPPRQELPIVYPLLQRRLRKDIHLLPMWHLLHCPRLCT